MRKFLFLLPLAAAFVGCSDTNVAGGPGSITTNGRVEKDGASVPFARISLRDVDHKVLPAGTEVDGIFTDAYADDKGEFKLKIPKEGSFRLVVSYKGDAFTAVVDAESGNSLETVKLVPTAVMQGEVDIPRGADNVWVGVLGTDILVPTDMNGVFVIPSLPANDSLQLYFVNDAMDSVLENRNVFFAPTEFVYESYKTPADTVKPDRDSVEVPVDSVKKVQVVTADGVPASYAAIALRASDHVADEISLHNSLVKADIRADADGQFSMEWPESGSFRLTVVAGIYSFSEVYDADHLSEIDTLKLDVSSSVSSKVTLKTGEDFAWVGAYGLDVLVKTDDQGAYVLPAVPAGKDLELYFIHADGGKPFVDWSVRTPREGAGFLSPERLLYDFEELDSLWYLSVDTLWKGSTYLFANGKTDNTHLMENHLEFDEGRNSQVFHGKYIVASDPYAWVLVGTGMDEERNFSAMDSIAFFAKGTGKIRLALENWENYNNASKAASAWVPLDTAWKRYVFKPSDLCYNSMEIRACEDTWNNVKNRVRQIHIFPSAGKDFYIDDVKLYGVLF